jgi:hypothetical protein
MKTLLHLLYFLLPISVFSQNAYLSHSYIEDDTNGFAVGDTITVKFEGLLMQSTPDFVMFDFQYNNKLLEAVDFIWNPTNSASWSGATQTSRNTWTGYKFTEGSNISSGDLEKQHDWWNGGAQAAGVNSYPQSADWTVNRITIQDANTLVSDTPWFYIKFKIKDKTGTAYNNYNDVTDINWARFRDVSVNGANMDVDAGTEKLSLTNIGGFSAGLVTINLQTPAKANYATDFGYSIYSSDQLTENGYPAQDEMPIHNGIFDANGQAQFTDLTLDETYWIHTHVVGTPAWLDEVLTVTDVYLIFQEAISAGTTPGGQGGAFEYQIQYEIGELNNSGNVNFDDSYVGLAYISGVDPGSTWFTSVSNGAFNLSGDVNTFGVSSNEYYFGLKHTFTVTSENKSFNFAHAFKGDPDFSHSFVPTAQGATTGNKAQTSAKASQAIGLTAKAMATPIIANLDINSTLVDGKVKVSINLNEEGIVGNQFSIIYDDTLLQLDSVNFDTGNEMTNFTNHNEQQNRIFVGSLDSDGDTAIKTGTPYTLIFTPLGQINNTAGLVTFKFTEGVKADGTKVKYNLQ